MAAQQIFKIRREQKGRFPPLPLKRRSFQRYLSVKYRGKLASPMMLEMAVDLSSRGLLLRLGLSTLLLNIP